MKGATICEQSIFHFDKVTTALFFFDGDMTVMNRHMYTRQN